MKDTRTYLVHILSCIQDIRDFVKDGRQAFEASRLQQAAVLRTLQVMAESTLRLPDENKSAYPDVGWQHIRNFRNRLVHEYLDIEPEIIWSIVEGNLPALEKAVAQMLADLESNNP